MWLANVLIVLALACCALGDATKVLCRYNSTSLLREGLARMTLDDLKPALPMCTHLIYGHAGIGDNLKIVSLNPILDLDHGLAYFRKVTQLKTEFPHLKILLSIGGGADRLGANDKYLELIVDSRRRLSFINSAHAMVQRFGFDGIDLAWQFPIDGQSGKPSGFLTFIDKLYLAFGIDQRFSRGTEESQEYREGFSAFVQEFREAFEQDQLIVSITVNPRVTLAYFFEFHNIYEHASLITLPTYDLWTPDVHPDEAFHPTWRNRSNKFGSIEHLASLIHNDIDHRMAKTIFAIPSYGRTWKLGKYSTRSGIPPIIGLSQPGAAGPLSRQAGLLSYPEICANLPDADNRIVEYDRFQLANGSDANGAYAYRLPDRNGDYGIWIGYDDPTSLADKVEMAIDCGVTGFALVDLGYDDFRGTCGGDKFPLLSAIHENVALMNAQNMVEGV